jgi:hypothetical protein
MDDNFISGQYDVGSKSKLKKFYDDNRIFIYSVLFAILIVISAVSFYSYSQNKKKTSLAQDYISANILIKNEDKDKALRILKKIVYSDDSTYSSLSLFLIINENLEEDNTKLLELYDHVLENNKFEEEVKNLIILKKAFYETKFDDEKKLLDTIKPLLGKESIWKANALMLAGNYFISKGENLKAKEFFLQVLDIKNLNNEIIESTKQKLRLINND